jgi:predicted N-acyltransferase
VLFLAERGRRAVAGALNLLGTDTLYGRYWGCLEDHKFLHFELCYYRAIDFAIANGLERVEAGAQGPHKIQRGYLPRPIFSAHYVRHPGFREAVAEFLARERRQVAFEMRALGEHSPFRKTAEDDSATG